MERWIFICFCTNLSWNHWKKLMKLFVRCEKEKTPKTTWEKEEEERCSRCHSRVPSQPLEKSRRIRYCSVTHGEVNDGACAEYHDGVAGYVQRETVPWEGLMLEQGKSLKRKGGQRKPPTTWPQPPHCTSPHTTQRKEVEELGMRDWSWSWEEEGVIESLFQVFVMGLALAKHQCTS